MLLWLGVGAIGIVAGLSSGAVGFGGGVLLVPLLALTLGVDQHTAQGICLAATLPPLGLPALREYRRNGVKPSLAIAGVLIVAYLVFSPLGGWLALELPARYLRLVFAGGLVLTAVRMLLAPGALDRPGPVFAPLWLTFGIGTVSGLVGGLLGAGAGVVIVPALRRFARIPRLEAQATCLATLVPPIALPAVLVYARQPGGLPWGVIGVVAGGYAAGALAGAKLAPKLNGRTAAIALAAVLGLMAIALALKA